MRGNKKHQKTTSCIQDYDYGKPQTHSSYETLPPAIHKRPGPEHCSPALVPSNSKAWIHYCIFVHLYTIYICLWYVCTFCNMFEGRLSKPCYFALFGLWSPFDTIDSIGLLILETITMEPLLPTAGENGIRNPSYFLIWRLMLVSMTMPRGGGEGRAWVICICLAVWQSKCMSLLLYWWGNRISIWNLVRPFTCNPSMLQVHWNKRPKT